jgi:hypothetical protein
MYDLELTYAFLSNYEETIFLRQVVNGGVWELQYSSVIEHTTVGEQRTPANFEESVSLR